MATSKTPLRLCVIETDVPTEEESKHDRYGHVFADLFRKAAKTLPQHHDDVDTFPDVKLTFKDAVQGELPSDEEMRELDAIVISGSKFDAHDEETPWIQELVKFLDHAWNHKDPAVRSVKHCGVCFGMQILARMLGGEIEAGKDWELSEQEIELTEDGKKLFDTKENSLTLMQMHGDQVLCVPKLKNGEECRVWGRSEHTQIQGLYLPGRLFTTQGHLGFDEQMVNANIDRSQKVESP
ncbi:class I glutamine amidotransferase-like protein [Protomyces lactucae-debilis]|uniref:Class I glutamine amidotransferase-like protein n=1 Tax=Protomyces lactucae-debilis TaxID=2754530 RepID=A0A1Y2FCC5_PROLT|nr:class I glutamine amidotransferase-like protein [Protomyces lactucae-debilis]ORY80966.1 class I glutamine amidotransferase-like protein [Protomyces lactucae-debilis]